MLVRRSQRLYGLVARAGIDEVAHPALPADAVALLVVHEGSVPVHGRVVRRRGVGVGVAAVDDAAHLAAIAGHALARLLDAAAGIVHVRDGRTAVVVRHRVAGPAALAAVDDLRYGRVDAGGIARAGPVLAHPAREVDRKKSTLQALAEDSASVASRRNAEIQRKKKMLHAIAKDSASVASNRTTELQRKKDVLHTLAEESVSVAASRAAEKAEAERIRMEIELLDAERAAAEKREMERIAAERAAAGKREMERIAPEKTVAGPAALAAVDDLRYGRVDAGGIARAGPVLAHPAREADAGIGAAAVATTVAAVTGAGCLAGGGGRSDAVVIADEAVTALDEAGGARGRQVRRDVPGGRIPPLSDLGGACGNTSCTATGTGIT